MRIGRFAFGICTYGRFIFVVGGIKEVVQVDQGQATPDSLTDCDDYNVLEDKWDLMPSLPQGRIGPSLIVVNQTLYCIGGVGKLSNILSFSLKGDSTVWQEIRGEMPLWCHQACFHMPQFEQENSDQISFMILGGSDLENRMSSAIEKVTINLAQQTFGITQQK